MASTILLMFLYHFDLVGAAAAFLIRRVNTHQVPQERSAGVGWSTGKRAGQERHGQERHGESNCRGRGSRKGVYRKRQVGAKTWTRVREWREILARKASGTMPPAAAPTDGVAGHAPSTHGPSVALMFLTVGEVKNPQVWEEWLRDAPQASWNVYVHAKEQDNVKHPLFADNLVRAVKTKWGTVSLVKAHVTLIKQALRDAGNKWFILLSDSCLPLIGFDALLQRLKNQYQLSSFDLHTARAQKVERDNVRNIMSDVLDEMKTEPSSEEALIKSITDHDDLTAHSQWCVLTRKDAEILARGGDLEVWYRAYKQMLRLELVKRSYLLAPDELFILTYLRHSHRVRDLPYLHHNRKSTFAHCCLDMINCTCSLGRAAHPMSFQALRKELVLHAFVAGSLFARKFDGCMKMADFRALWAAMESEPNQVLEVAEMSSALANPERLTQRQQLAIAMKLSKRGAENEQRHSPQHLLLGADPAPSQTPPPPLTPPSEDSDALMAVEAVGGRGDMVCAVAGATSQWEVCSGLNGQSAVEGGNMVGDKIIGGGAVNSMQPKKMSWDASQLPLKKRFLQGGEEGCDRGDRNDGGRAASASTENPDADKVGTCGEGSQAEMGVEEAGHEERVESCGVEADDEEWESDGYEFSQRDVGMIVEIDCAEDGMLPVVLLKHRKDEVFLVQFMGDKNTMEVDLGRIRYRLRDKERHSGARGQGEGARASKKKRVPDKRKKQKSKWKVWEEEMLDKRDESGSVGPLSREERKAIAVWQQFQALEKRVAGTGNGERKVAEMAERVCKHDGVDHGDTSECSRQENTNCRENTAGVHEDSEEGRRGERRHEWSGRSDLTPDDTDKVGGMHRGGEGGGSGTERKSEDALPACEAKSELSREEKKLLQQIQLFKRMEMIQGAGRANGEGNTKKRSKAKEENSKHQSSDHEAESQATTGLRVKSKSKWEDAVPQQETKTELSREERKLMQQMKLFHKMKVEAKTVRHESSKVRKEDKALHGDEREDKFDDDKAAKSHGRNSGTDESVRRDQKARWEDAVPLRESKTLLSRDDRKMIQQMQLFTKMEASKDKVGEKKQTKSKVEESSEEEETSEDEDVTSETPRPKYELEEFAFAKYGDRLYLGKVFLPTTVSYQVQDMLVVFFTTTREYALIHVLVCLWVRIATAI
jgi:hypothetical protein